MVILHICVRRTEIILNIATLSILSADSPQITQHPKHQSVSLGAAVAFNIEATGDDLQFQWQKDSKDVDRNTSQLQYIHTDKSSTLNIWCVKKSDKGHYRCLVTNPVDRNGKTSCTAELTVREFSCTWSLYSVTCQPKYLPFSKKSREKPNRKRQEGCLGGSSNNLTPKVLQSADLFWLSVHSSVATLLELNIEVWCFGLICRWAWWL